ncbi:MAG: formylmethanofuran dehydrogenase subunit E family protein [Thermoplasmata archaeon]|nr:formylmethanofuran dehydrogenase subunit E family protein [Thermoplasmata archaeon]
MDDELRLIERFHGHIGPYAILGHRAGQIANRVLGRDPFAKRATVHTGTAPPLSCFIDGIQLASGCTMGKGNIVAIDGGEARAVFSDGQGKRTLEVRLRREVPARIREVFESGDQEAFCEWCWTAPETDIFEVVER